MKKRGCFPSLNIYIFDNLGIINVEYGQLRRETI